MSSIASPKAPPSESRNSDTKPGFTLSSRKKIWLLATCLTVMIGASVFALFQPLSADPFDATLSARFWYPRETNPYAHLPAVHCANSYACRFNSVAVNGSGNLPEVWAVGNVGLVLHRATGQTKWEQLSITATEERSSTPSPTPTQVPRPSPTATPVRKSDANPNEAPNAAAPTPTPAANQSQNARGISASTVTVPSMLGLGIDEAQKMAIKSGLRLEVQYESGSAPNPTAQQGPSTGLRIVMQSPEPETVVSPNSVITVILGRPPKSKARLLMDRLVPTVYAAEPEPPQQGSSTRRTQRNPTQRSVQVPADSGSPNSQQIRISPLDDDLISVICLGPDCRALGRSGRVYWLENTAQWTFVQARFVDAVTLKNLPERVTLFSPTDRFNVFAKSGSAFYLCPYFGIYAEAERDSVKCQLSPSVSLPTIDNQFLVHEIDNPPVLAAPSIVDTSTRLLIGENGFIGKTPTNQPLNAAKITKVPSNTTATLFEVEFASSMQGFIVGDSGIILSSTDRGNTWRHETQGPEGAAPNHRLPALWYWVLAVFMTVFCSVVVAAPLPLPKTEFSIADWAVSDAPLKPGDFDSLGFTPMALGLSRFIRNPKTQPPVTIAIEGEWGEGKSSVMSLLRGDLEKSRFRPVWFNAWHHQSEDQLLAALLEHIKSQAIPPWWHVDNWIFRARLLRIRFREKWPQMIALVLVLCAGVSYELSRHGLKWEDFNAFGQDVIHLARYLLPWSSEKTPPNDLSHFGLVVTITAVFVAIFKKAQAFGIDPAKLTDNLRDAATIKDVKPDPGIRRQFAREFGDLCSAWCWGGRRVIIFIDDLDRCRPESVVTVLESINFLTTAGDCMIVLGMAQKQVTHCVGLSFKDIAQAEEAYRGGSNTEQEKAVARFNYGALYIKKLVNIVAPLPKTTEVQRRMILNARAAAARERNDEEKASEAKKWRSELWQSLSQTGRLAFKVAPVFGLLLAVVLSVLIGYRQGISGKVAPADNHVPQPALPVAAAAPTPLAAHSNTTDSKSTVAKPLIYDRPTAQPATLADSNNASGEVWSSYAVDALFLFIFFGMLAYQLTTRTNQDAQNSPQFEESLKLWGPYIVGVCDTPREIKRALNDLRYQAMTRRTNGPSSTRGERMIRSVRQFVTGRSEEPPTAKRVDEAALPAWKAGVLANLTDEEWKYFLDPQSINELPNISENLKLLLKLKSTHMKQFENRWIPEASLVAGAEPEDNAARAASNRE